MPGCDLARSTQPRERRFYRFVRNPMYEGFATGWIGLWIVFGHANLPAIATVVAVALAVHLFIVFYEEPTLRGKFGADYEQYCRNVNRWRPGMRGWNMPSSRLRQPEIEQTSRKLT